MSDIVVLPTQDQPLRRVFIDTGGETCPKRGSVAVMESFKKAIRRAGLEGRVEVVARGCFGLCSLAPNLYVQPDNIWYSKFTIKDVPVIVRQHFLKGKPVSRLIHYPERPEKRPKIKIRRVSSGRGNRSA